MNALAGKRVAFTGQLASMTRPEAADLVRAHGGTFITSVTRRTSFLVIGQEGWPLRKDGGLTEKLETAKHLQVAGCDITILTEEELLERLGMDGATSGIHKRFNFVQLGRLLKVRRDRLRAWMRLGLLNPVENKQGVCYFDFQQVTGVRTLWGLAQAGVKLDTIRRSLEQLNRWISSSDAPLAHLQILEREGQVLMRLNDGQLVEPSGQLRFDFENQGDPVTQVSPLVSSAAEWWHRGCALEEAGQLGDAAKAYREALYLGGPAANVCFNLANVLFGLGQLGQSAERYREAVELDHNCMEAWNNLGNVLLELGHADDALESFQRPWKSNPPMPTRITTWPMLWNKRAGFPRRTGTGRNIFAMSRAVSGRNTPDGGWLTEHRRRA